MPALPFNTLTTVAGRLPVLRLKVQIKMLAAGCLADNAGALFHGSLGWAMADVDTALWQLCYGPLAQQDSRAFSILPPPTPCQWQAGDRIWFEFVGLAEVALLLKALIATFVRMGERGFGEQPLRFELQQVSQITPYGQCLLWQQGLPLTMSHYNCQLLPAALLQALAFAETIPADRLLLRVECQSRLLLKAQRQVLRTAPSALQLARAVLRRLFSLQLTSVAEQQQIYSLLEPLRAIELMADHTRRDDLNRYSRQQQQRHVIEGITGHWYYRGAAIKQLLPWLVLAHWLQLGGKTSFGFGAIDWQLVVA
jgi:hypothetical protein